MWSSRLKFGRALGFLLAASLLASCGFSPIHGTNSTDGTSHDERLARIDVLPIPNREGQLLRNFLVDQFGIRPSGTKALYSVSSSISIDKQELGTQLDATTTRARLTVRADVEFAGQEYNKSFTVAVTASYSTSQSDYATLIAERDATKRALREIAIDIRRRILTYLN